VGLLLKRLFIEEVCCWFMIEVREEDLASTFENPPPMLELMKASY